MNQSEFKAYTGNRRQARENACKQVTIGLESGAKFSNQWHNILKEKWFNFRTQL